MACRDRPVVADAHPPPPLEPAQQTPSSSSPIIEVDSPDATLDLIELSSTAPDRFYAASASDTAPTRGLCPKRRPNRQHRRFRRRVFNKARQERLQSLTATTSDEEALPTFLKDGSVNPAFFRALPRPSDIVPAIDDGSASDAGYNTAEREAHNRRKAATVVGIDALDKDGTLSAITNWKKTMYNLQAYSDFLDPPPTDMQLPKVRVPAQLMTNYYRGVFLKRKQLWQKRKRRKLSDHSSVASGERLEFRDPQSTSPSDSSDANERNSPSPSRQNQDATSAEEMPPGIVRDPHGTNSWQMSTPFSKMRFLEYVNRCIAESDGPTLAEMLHISTHPFAAPQPRRQFSVPHLKQRTRPTNTNMPAPKPEVSHFKNFLSRMQESSSFLFQPVNPADYQPSVVQVEKQPKEENLSPFEKEKTLAMAFCGEKPDYLAARFRKLVEKESSNVPSVKLEHHLIPQKNDWVNPLPLKMMKKMGFKGRMGAKEDGKIEPVLAMQQGFRASLGVTPSVERHSGAARLLPAEGARGSSKDMAKQEINDSMKKGRVNLVSLKMMKKMGFKGRLGANEDGRSEPVFATQQGFRQGIGAAPTVALNSGGVSLFSTEHPEDDRKQKLRGISAGANIKTELNTPKPATSSREGRKRRVFKPKYIVKRRLITRKPVEKYVNSIALADNPNSDAEMQNAARRKVDSGRRAILIDFDCLLKGGRDRRLAAFRVLRKAFGVKEDPNFDMNILGDDLSDADAIELILQDKSDQQKRALAFSVLELEFKKTSPVLDKDLLETLRQQKAHFGILHRGSEERMRNEMGLLEIDESFLQGPACVTGDDEWPYLKTWNNLRTEVGTPATQTLFIGKALQENTPSKHQPGQLRLVGSYFNSMVGLVLEENGMMMYAPGEHEARTLSNGQSSIADVSLPPAVPCRKLAFYPNDALWFAADSFFHDVLGKRFWVEFRGLGKRAWVEEQNIDDLSRQNYALFKKKRFPGILDVDDVDLLE